MMRDRQIQGFGRTRRRKRMCLTPSSGEKISRLPQVGLQHLRRPFLQRLRSTIGLTISGTANNGRVIPKPELLDELVRIAKPPVKYFQSVEREG